MPERYHQAAMANPPAEQVVTPITMTETNTRSGEAAAPPAQPLVNLLGLRIRLRPFRPDEVETAWQGLAQQDEAAHPRRRPGIAVRSPPSSSADGYTVRGACGEAASIWRLTATGGSLASSRPGHARRKHCLRASTRSV